MKLLVAAGADATSKNAAGHDAAYEAERAEKTEVVEYLLKQLDTGPGESSAVEEQTLDLVQENGDEKIAATESELRKNKEHADEDVRELEKGIAGIATNGKGP